MNSRESCQPTCSVSDAMTSERASKGRPPPSTVRIWDGREGLGDEQQARLRDQPGQQHEDDQAAGQNARRP